MDASERAARRAFRDQTAIVGVGTTAFGAMYRDLDPERDPYQLGLVALREALADAGLSKDDLDGLIVSRMPHYGRMCEVLGMRHPRFVNVLPGEGRQSGIALQYAAMAIYTGLASVVACVYGNNGRSVGARYGGEARGLTTTAMYDAPYGMTSPGAVTAQMFRRHQHEYGTPVETLGHLAINNRKNAAHNENAVMREPITMDDYLGARFIAEPLRLFDYCLINDGGVAFIVTSAERARDLAKPPVLISATSQGADITPNYVADDFWAEPLGHISEEIFGAAEMTHADMDFAQLYDNFTPSMLFSLEGLGFAPQGEGADWITPERIALDGELPLNTSGGHTSESYMQGWALHVEAVRQLRGEGGARQVRDARVGLYACAAPLATAHILRSDA
jgi:acetyl-CoA acetyltransferase